MTDGISEKTRLRLLVAYKGTAFRGFAEQPCPVRTVAGSLREALEKVLRHPIDLTCAGRTDAGVHARGQVVSFDADLGAFDPDDLPRVINKLVAPEIAVLDASAVDGDFDARFSARSRRYRYTVLNTPVADPLRHDIVWWVPHSLDIDSMNSAAQSFVGEHDFGAFCRRPDVEASLVRNISEARWVKSHDELTFEIEANAFCHQMVRSIVGHLVEIGRGRRDPSDVFEVLLSKDRSRAGPIAPPQGLALWEVTY